MPKDRFTDQHPPSGSAEMRRLTPELTGQNSNTQKHANTNDPAIEDHPTPAISMGPDRSALDLARAERGTGR